MLRPVAFSAKVCAWRYESAETTRSSTEITRFKRLGQTERRTRNSWKTPWLWYAYEPCFRGSRRNSRRKQHKETRSNRCKRGQRNNDKPAAKVNTKWQREHPVSAKRISPCTLDAEDVVKGHTISTRNDAPHVDLEDQAESEDTTGRQRLWTIRG